jgi:hypothetical protein
MTSADADLGTFKAVVRRAIETCRPRGEPGRVVVSREPAVDENVLKFDVARELEPTRWFTLMPSSEERRTPASSGRPASFSVSIGRAPSHHRRLAAANRQIDNQSTDEAPVTDIAWHTGPAPD